MIFSSYILCLFFCGETQKGFGKFVRNLSCFLVCALNDMTVNIWGGGNLSVTKTAGDNNQGCTVCNHCGGVSVDYPLLSFDQRYGTTLKNDYIGG